MLAIRFLPMGDQALHFIISEQIDLKIHQQIFKISHQLTTNPIPGVVEWVPTYQAITFFYRPESITYHQLCTEIKERQLEATTQQLPLSTRKIRIPVLYGNPWGIDLEHVARTNQLSPEEVVKIHQQPTYLVYMIGFTPGFPYLGGMSQSIATPRKKIPRKQVPRGSVGIADQQTGIYSLDTPGGWNLIGRTPIRLFDPTRQPASLLRTGDQIEFYPIESKEYDKISMAWEKQTYKLEINFQQEE